MLESTFKTNLKNEIIIRFPGSFVVHLDPNEIQGFPDLLILYKNRWAALEGKRDEDAPRQPNQEYYVDVLNSMSFSAFIYPENKEEVLNEMERSLKS